MSKRSLFKSVIQCSLRPMSYRTLDVIYDAKPPLHQDPVDYTAQWYLQLLVSSLYPGYTIIHNVILKFCGEARLETTDNFPHHRALSYHWWCFCLGPS